MKVENKDFAVMVSYSGNEEDWEYFNTIGNANECFEKNAKETKEFDWEQSVYLYQWSEELECYEVIDSFSNDH
jgi:endonuclease I